MSDNNIGGSCPATATCLEAYAPTVTDPLPRPPSLAGRGVCVCLWRQARQGRGVMWCGV